MRGARISEWRETARKPDFRQEIYKIDYLTKKVDIQTKNIVYRKKGLNAAFQSKVRNLVSSKNRPELAMSIFRLQKTKA